MTTKATNAKPGRPSTYTPEILQQILLIIRQCGLSDSAAAEAAGVSTSTLSRWKQAHPQLLLRLCRARQEFRLEQLRIIHETAAAKGGWRAAAWLLERIFPKDYHPRASERAKFQQARAAEEAALGAAADAEDDEPASEPTSQNSRNATTPPAPIVSDWSSPFDAPASKPLSRNSRNSARPRPLSGSILTGAA